MSVIRCEWAGKDPIYRQYHDEVWGRPVVDSKTLFAKLCLDGQQAGLSWLTILKRQANYQEAFAQFEPKKIVLFDANKIEEFMLNSGIIRNRQKINSIINNAKAYLAIEERGTEFNDFIWQFVEGKTIVNQWQQRSQIPVTTLESDKMAKALKIAGFSFVGSTICYAFMQAMGLVNDHTTDCHCHQKCAALARR
ncbi:DNA-3-methyladenine glycosylase I [Alteromonadaceae bacterium BrNp21-10]|nr:DNA-3-methyladenine glycosylase I [Alteromonadaceae bacterium BrNp21-10]